MLFGVKLVLSFKPKTMSKATGKGSSTFLLLTRAIVNCSGSFM